MLFQIEVWSALFDEVKNGKEKTLQVNIPFPKNIYFHCSDAHAGREKFEKKLLLDKDSRNPVERGALSQLILSLLNLSSLADHRERVSSAKQSQQQVQFQSRLLFEIPWKPVILEGEDQ